jgi:hypothetical protein
MARATKSTRQAAGGLVTALTALVGALAFGLLRSVPAIPSLVRLRGMVRTS